MSEEVRISWGDKVAQWRFQQILQNVDVESRNGEDLFYEESYDTLTALTNNTIVRSILSKTAD